MPLLKESRLNHFGKLAFRWIYWHMLLPGRDLPGISPRMSLAGKQYNGPASAPGAAPEGQPVTTLIGKES
jgi:sulfide:quinone oxidoreductase